MLPHCRPTGRAGQVSVSKGWGLLCICCHHDSPVGTERVKTRSWVGSCSSSRSLEKEGQEEAGLRLEPSRRSHGPSTAVAQCPDPGDFPLLMISRKDRGVPSTRGAVLVRCSSRSVPGVHPTLGSPAGCRAQSAPPAGTRTPCTPSSSVGTASYLGPPGSSGVG